MIIGQNMAKIKKKRFLVLQNGKFGSQNNKIWKIWTILHHLVNFLSCHPYLIIEGKDEIRWKCEGAGRGMGGLMVKTLG